jgi:hypothetical protein
MQAERETTVPKSTCSIANVRRISRSSVDIDRRANCVRSIVAPLVDLGVRQIVAEEQVKRGHVAIGILRFGGGTHTGRQISEDVPAKGSAEDSLVSAEQGNNEAAQKGRSIGEGPGGWAPEGGPRREGPVASYPGEQELIRTFGLSLANCIVQVFTAAFESPYAMPSKSVSAE